MELNIEQQIRELAINYANELARKTNDRIEEMQQDDCSHFLIYHVLGVSTQEGNLIDLYQNKGRFLYNSAGRFLEEVTKLCFLSKYPNSGTIKIPNIRGQRPKTFEIDCLVGNDAIEIKWRDATTDGDHITKEYTRISNIKDAGFRPIRIMFFYPNRVQAMKIQETLATLYQGIGGSYYFGDLAWQYIREKTDISLKEILEKIAIENTGR